MEKIDFAEDPTQLVPIKQVQASGLIVFISNGKEIYFLTKVPEQKVEGTKGEFVILPQKFRWLRLADACGNNPISDTFFDSHKEAISTQKENGEFFVFSSITEFLTVAKRRNWL